MEFFYDFYVEKCLDFLWFSYICVLLVVSLITSFLLLLWLWLLLFLRSNSDGVFTVCDEQSIPSSSSVEAWFRLESIGCEWIIVSIFPIGDASRDVFVFSVLFVNVKVSFSRCDF